MRNLLPPPWIKFPFLSEFCIGWRMGYGEEYKFRFGEWFNSLSKSDQSEYRTLFPEPIFWSSWWDGQLKSENLTFWHNDFFVDLWENEPRYSLKWLIKRHNSGKKSKFLFFWGHQNGATLDKSCLSQWYGADFIQDTQIYANAEQYMMAKKAKCFGDDEILKKILSTRDPKQIKAFGRQVSGFKESVWDRAKFGVVLMANYLKFSQDPKLREFLLSTKDKILTEASPYDKIWGIGMDANDENSVNPTKWQGQNLLGFALMRVRDEIGRVYANVYLCDQSELKTEM